MARNFNVPSGEMLTQSRAVRILFNGDKAAFTGLDLSFSDPFSADWLASIEASEVFQTAEQREDYQMILTDKVLADMETARSAYKKAKYFIEKAFGDRPSDLRFFGLDDYEEARDDQRKMTVFLGLLHAACINPTYNVGLTAAGMTPADILEIQTAKNNFASDNQTQDAFIMSTQGASRDRDNQYNSTFEFWQKVNKASKVVFEGDPIKLNEYLLPEGPQPDPDINLKGKALDAINNKPLNNVTVKLVELDIVTTTNYAGNYNFVSIPAGTYTLRFVLAGYVTQEIPVTILASGVVVQNVSMAVA